MRQFIYYNAGNGRRVPFWKDNSSDIVPLSNLMNLLYSIVANKEAAVVGVWDPTGVCWSSTFSRAFNDWELPLVDNLLLKLKRRFRG